MTEKEKKHYFDWAATSPADTDILTAALQESLENWGNPSSLHKAGKAARTALESYRAECADVLGVKPETVYFTSGGTESDHIPLLSILTRPERGTILISSLEHPAIREQAAALEHCGWTVTRIPSTVDGFITPEAVADCLTDDTVIVCVMAVNNETGAIQDIRGIADVLQKCGEKKRKPFFHVDCVQAAGKIPIDISYKGIDSAAFSAHKLCGPRGIGILYLAHAVQPFLRGGGQEKNIRSGTENLFGAACFAACLGRYFLTAKNSAAQKRFEKQKKTTAGFLEELTTLPGCRIIPQGRVTTAAERFSPWIIQASFAGIPGQVMVRALSEEGFFISTGSACSAKKNSRPVLEAMNISPQERETAVRFSFGPLTEEQDMHELFAAVRNICTAFS